MADGADRVEVLRQHLVVVHFDAEGRFEEAHQLEYTGGVDDPGVEQRGVVRDRIAVVAEQEILADEAAYSQADVVVHGQAGYRASETIAELRDTGFGCASVLQISDFT